LSVRHRADIGARGFYNSRIAYYTFRICQGSYSSDIPAVLADDAAAWDEGSKACGDLILTIIDKLRPLAAAELGCCYLGERRFVTNRVLLL
jgi:hypothetical protein